MHPYRLSSKVRWLPPWGLMDSRLPKRWPEGFRATWIEVDLEALGKNLNVLQSGLPSQCRIAAVVKDNAYGHGMIPVARHLEPHVEMLAVAILEEAVQLRKAGIQCPILVLNGLWPGQEIPCLNWHAIPVISSWESLLLLDQAVKRCHLPPAVYHLKLDTGMHRWGVPYEELDDFLGKSACFSNVQCEGVLTHLACADDKEADFTEEQLGAFHGAMAAMAKRGIYPRWIHAANSSGVLCHRKSHFNLVRPGISLYGYDPRGKQEAGCLQPILSLKSRIALVKQVQSGEAVGYGYTHIFTDSAKIAIIPIGYGDGFSRAWSNRGKILINGYFASVIGRVSMDAITVDISSIPEVAVGDEVVLLGKSGSNQIWADDFAEQLGSISYEILTSLSPRIGRIYLNGKAN